MRNIVLALSAFGMAVMSFFAGCASETPVSALTQAQLATSAAYLVCPAKYQASFVADAKLIAAALQAASTNGTPPTATDLQGTLLAKMPANDQLVMRSLIATITALYSGQVSTLPEGASSAQVSQYLADISTGILAGLPSTAFLVPLRPPLAFALPIHPPLTMIWPIHQQSVAFYLPTHPPTTV